MGGCFGGGYQSMISDNISPIQMHNLGCVCRLEFFFFLNHPTSTKGCLVRRCSSIKGAPQSICLLPGCSAAVPPSRGQVQVLFFLHFFREVFCLLSYGNNKVKKLNHQGCFAQDFIGKYQMGCPCYGLFFNTQKSCQSKAVAGVNQFLSSEKKIIKIYMFLFFKYKRFDSSQLEFFYMFQIMT